MKHLCSCGEIVEAEGDSLLVADCPNCGKYYIYTSEVLTPLDESKLLKEIQSKVHSHKEVLEELLLDEELTPFQPLPISHEDILEDDEEMPVKVKPRAAKRR